MRSFKSKVLSAYAWAVPALAAVLPATVDHNPVIPEIVKPTVLDLDLQENYAQATFSVPCPGCLGSEGTSQDDDSIILSFAAHSSDEPCGASNLTLNGANLPQQWQGDFASGSGSFQGIVGLNNNARDLQHTLDLEWETACLNPNGTEETEVSASDVAQVLTVTIKSIDGIPLDRVSGFTISYKQLSPPELLRLERSPSRSASEKKHAASWLQPPRHLRLVSPSPSPEDPSVAGGSTELSLEDEIQELKVLQAQLAQLHQAINEKENFIHSQLQKDSKSLKEELHQCTNITCVVKALAHKAHGAWRVVYISLRPTHHPLPPPSEMGRPDDRYHRLGNHKQAPEAGLVRPDASNAPQISATTRLVARTTATTGLVARTSATSVSNPRTSASSVPTPQFSATAVSYPEISATSIPEPEQYSDQVHPLGHQRRPVNPLVVALEILVGVLCCGCLVTIVRNRCCSLRSRTERAARREERANARAYRRAARKLRFQNWWRGKTWRDQQRIADYEEKRALINEQESVLEQAMQNEIRQLREAHGLVNSLVQAEEGRLPTHHNYHCHSRHHAIVPPPPPHPDHQHHDQPPYSPASSVFTRNSLAELPSRPMSRSSSLPGYPSSNASTDPPAYESDEDTSEHVADGFRQYIPSHSSIRSAASSRWTPDSSVVDVSPRPSAETLRYPDRAESLYAELSETGVGDAKN